jgi:hypothetical protein
VLRRDAGGADDPPGANDSPGEIGKGGARDAVPAVPVIIPVVAEEVTVEKRTVETGRVRVRTTVHEREEVVDEPLLREEVTVETVPVGRLIDTDVPVPRTNHTKRSLTGIDRTEKA